MNIDAMMRRMEGFGGAVRAAVSGVTDEESRWKPPHPKYPNGAWSILEIVCHLGDEEVEDFRARLRMTLEKPGQPWPPTDPEGWAAERKYNEQDLGAALTRLESERAASIVWLRSLRSPHWNLAYVHPRFGPIRAGDLMVSWAAHDALHLRQIAKRKFELAGRDGAGFETSYAGEWGA